MKSFFASLRLKQIPTLDIVDEAIDKIVLLKTTLDDLKATIVFLSNNPENIKAKNKLIAQLESIRNNLKREEVLVDTVRNRVNNPENKRLLTELEFNLCVCFIRDYLIQNFNLLIGSSNPLRKLILKINEDFKDEIPKQFIIKSIYLEINQRQAFPEEKMVLIIKNTLFEVGKMTLYIIGPLYVKEDINPVIGNFDGMKRIERAFKKHLLNN